MLVKIAKLADLLLLQASGSPYATSISSLHMPAFKRKELILETVSGEV